VGVTVRSRAKDAEFRVAATALWRRSAQELDPEGLLSFGGMQAQAVRGRRVSGEIFLRRRRRLPEDGLAVPLQVQILEAEMVPLGYQADLANGNYVRDGIEYTIRGARAAYWMYTEHPQDDGRATAAGRL
jgi:capsid protein